MENAYKLETIYEKDVSKDKAVFTDRLRSVLPDIGFDMNALNVLYSIRDVAFLEMYEYARAVHLRLEALKKKDKLRRFHRFYNAANRRRNLK